MPLAPSNRRAFAGLIFAMPLVAIGPIVAVAQYGNVQTRSSGYPTATAPRGVSQSGGAMPKRESLFGDQGLSWKMPFTRSKTPPKSQISPRQPMTGKSVPRVAQQAPRAAAGQQNRANIPNARMPLRTPPTSSGNAPRPAVQPAAQTPVTVQRDMPRATTSQPPRTMRPAVNVSPVPAARSVPSTNWSTSDSQTKKILAQAHAWSLTASSEAHYTRIIQACRQAADAQTTPDITRYANELASWALNRRGQLKAEANREDEALRDFDAAIQADAQRWRPVHNRGVLLAGDGEFEKAFNDFSRTIELNPPFAKAYSNRAALFVVAGKLQDAIRDYTTAIELDPELTVAHRGLGRACHLDGQAEVAIRHYDEAVRLAPNDAYAITSRADVLTDLGRYAEAADEYERAIQADPDSSHAHSGSAWLLATCPDDSVRNPTLALQRAQAAIELTGDKDAAFLDTLAAAQAVNGDFAGATKTIHEAVQLATPDAKEMYLERLALYEQEQPFRLEPPGNIVQASHEN